MNLSRRVDENEQAYGVPKHIFVSWTFYIGLIWTQMVLISELMLD